MTPSGLEHALDFEYKEISGDKVVIQMVVGAHHLQPFGLVHGGVYCALAESAASIAAVSWLGSPAVGVSNHTDFISSAREGAVLTATATPIQRGRRQQLWEIDIRDAQDRRVAWSKVRMHNLDIPSQPSGQ